MSLKKKHVDTLIPAPVSHDAGDDLPVEEKPKAEAPPVATVASPPSPKYRVKKDCKASFFGQLVRLKKDDVIDQAGYGAEGIKRLIESGADLEEIK